MIAFLRLLLAAALSSFRARYRVEIENLVLRHQINVLRRAAPKRVRPTGTERLLLVWLYRLWPDVLRSVTIVTARNGRSLAPSRLASVLALEVTRYVRASEGGEGHPRPDPRNQ